MRLKLLLLAIIYLPGTAVHELSHFFVAKLLGVRTGKISLIPRFHDNGLELGHVEIAKTDIVRRFLIGVAPLFIGVIILLVVVYLIINFNFSFLVYLILSYVLVAVINTMTLSKSDMQGAWKILTILAIALLIIFALH